LFTCGILFMIPTIVLYHEATNSGEGRS
jgi:hypothetical protein